jgi:hypothetical protein
MKDIFLIECEIIAEF